jgi:ribosomal protein L11 methyltransferase
MAWLRLTITSRPSCLEDLSDLLEKFEADSISYSPGSDEAIFGDESPADTYWEQTAVSALFDAGIDMDILLACVRNKLGTENIINLRIEPVKDAAWDVNLKSAFKPMLFSNRLCICPSWHTQPLDIPYIIQLDPGLAFGTGSHATTSLCLQWLADNDIAGKSVIDYGCGSGILGLAAARLGASQVVAVDIDPQALQATDSNAGINQVEDLIQTMLPGDARIQPADILVANILLNPLLGLVETFKSLLGPGGKIVMSGILANQTEQCLQTYSHWFAMDTPVYRDEWVLLSGTRKRVS